MVDPLAPLLADGVVDEVVGRLKTGKEAELWLVRHAGELLAAKVYKARQARSFKNRSAYQEGRQVRNTRTQRAMQRGTGFGRASEEDAWKIKEADALHALHAAGVRVPRPVMFYEGVLLMELVVDAGGHPAPRLIDAHVPRDQAAALYADLRAQAVRMLASDLVHGDLSPYNVLLGQHGPVVIDFPQVVGAAHNSQAERFFRRDLENLRHFFAAIDPGLHRAAGDAAEIWRAYVRRELTFDFVPSGKPPEPHRHGPARAEHHPAHGHGHGGHGHAAPGHQRAAQPPAPQERRPHPDRAERRAQPDRGAPRPHPPGGKPRPPGRSAGPPPAGPERSRGDRPRGRPPGPEVIRLERRPLGHPSAPPHRGGPAPAAGPPHRPSPPQHGVQPHRQPPHPGPPAAPRLGTPPAGPGAGGPPGEGGQRRRRRRRRR